jgi:hypothetical protein
VDETWWSLVIWHGGMGIKLGGHLLFGMWAWGLILVVTCYLAWGHGDETWWSLVIWHGGIGIKLGGHLLFGMWAWG